MKDIKLFIIMGRTVPRLFVINAIFILLLSVFETLSVFSIAPVIDLYRYEDLSNVSSFTKKFINLVEILGLPPQLITAIVLFILTITLKNVFVGLSRYSTLKIKYSFIKETLAGSLSKYFSARWSFFSFQSQGKILNTLVKELNQVGDAVGNLGTLLRDFVKLLFLTFFLFSISWQLAVISIISFSIIYIPSFIFGRKSYTYGVLATSTGNTVQLNIKEALDNAKGIMSAGLGKRLVKNLSDNFEKHSFSAISGQMVQSLITLFYEPLIICIVLGIVYIGSTVFSKSVTELIVFLYALKSIYPLFINIILIKNRFKNILPGYEQIKALEAEAEQLEIKEGPIKFESLKEKIIFEEVEFSFPDRSFKLEKLNLEVEKGKRVALVGASGAGKSTLVDLLLKHYECSGGRILIDNEDLREIDTDSFRSKVGVVLQSNDLFSLSIKENLLLSNPNATAEDIDKALKDSYCSEFVSDLPDGVDTSIGNRGSLLSGGQKQRLCIAMALIRNPEILILDEATSALDNESENKIKSSMQLLDSDITLIMVAHRLSTIKDADEIFVFDGGKIVEMGTYLELMDKNGFFFNLVNSESILKEV